RPPVVARPHDRESHMRFGVPGGKDAGDVVGDLAAAPWGGAQVAGGLGEKADQRRRRGRVSPGHDAAVADHRPRPGRDLDPLDQGAPPTWASRSANTSAERMRSPGSSARQAAKVSAIPAGRVGSISGRVKRIRWTAVTPGSSSMPGYSDLDDSR